MARVTGIGGFFFRARDPDALNAWYARHFDAIMPDSREYSDPGPRGGRPPASASRSDDAAGNARKTREGD